MINLNPEHNDILRLFFALFSESQDLYKRETNDCHEGEDCHRHCGGTINEPGQIIRSLNTTSNEYDNNLDCRWLIKLDRLSQIRLTVVSFELESGAAMDHMTCT